MKLMLSIFAGAALLELLSLYLPAVARKYMTSLTLVFTSFASTGLVFERCNVASLCILLISVYRILNILRVIQARINEAYLRKVSRRTSLWLVGFQALAFVLWFFIHKYSVADRTWLMALAALQLLVALVLFLSAFRHLRTTRLRREASAYVDKDLPTVTVAIPARNEDDQLDECLRSLVASNYAKLEIIVLDDCSQDKTPEIIRGFAHDGVRFVPGEEPKETWLAKNQAYDRLAKEASGSLIVFCGVDTRFAPDTIRQLVAMMLGKQKRMVSLMLLNEQHSPSMPQVMRYLWELALPRRMFNRPPVLSSCWAIMAEDLKRLGGFAAVSRSIVPEAYFARELIKTDAYSFARSDKQLGLASVKTAYDQRQTAVRTRYPQLHRRIELVVVLTAGELALLVLPFVLFITGLFVHFNLLIEVFTAAAVILLMLTYRIVEFVAFPHNRWLVFPAFVFAVLYDVAFVLYSMWKYEFSEVIWKGRNVCVPAMQVIAHLPKI